MPGVAPALPKFQFFSSTGAPLANGTVTVYLAGTTTPTNTWQDSALSILNTNPIQLDARGEAVIWLDSSVNYKFLLKNAAGATQWTEDNISGAAPANTSGITFLQAGTGAVARTAQSKMRESVSVLDFGADSTGVADCAAAIASAFTAAPAGEIVFPVGTYRVNSGTLVIPDGAVIRFAGRGAKIDYRGSDACLQIRNSKNIALYDLNIDLTNAGASAVGLSVQGCWWLQLYKPKFQGGNASQQLISIETSHSSGLGWGAYLIEIHNPQLSGTAGYGINCYQSGGDSVDVTHLNIYGGWAKSCNYGLYLRNVAGGQIRGFVADSGIDGMNIASCSDLLLEPGELGPNSGYGINFGTGCSGIHFIAPNKSGVGGTSGYMNTGNYTPQLFDQGVVRLYGSRTDQTYYAELKSIFNNAESVNLTSNHGSVVTKLLNYGATPGYEFNSNYTYTWKQGGAVQMQLASGGALWLGNVTGTGHIFELSGLSQGDGKLTVFGTAQFQQVSAFSPNVANAALRIGENSVTSRSINAGGTVNASGADYAEYERNNGLVIAKGAIVGFKADGTLTLTFSEAVRFGIKSTKPAYVGGDDWAAGITDEQALEEARLLVDRIAYSGKVPVNVTGATAGQYIVAAQAADGSITGEATSDLDFAQYKRAVGRVNRVMEDGRAEVAVIVH